jgi:hypothetical protein
MGAVFIPHQPPPTARARALGDMLAEAINQFRLSHSDISSYEIHQAVQVALSKSLGGRHNPNRATALAGAVAAIVLAGVLVSFLQKQETPSNSNEILFVLPVMAIIAAVVIVVRLRRG